MGRLASIASTFRRGLAVALVRIARAVLPGALAWGSGWSAGPGWTTAPRSLPAARAGRTIDATSYRDPVVRTFLDWSPDDLRTAQALADQGSLLRAADLCEWIRGDDRASSVLRTRVLALLGAPLTFDAAASGRLRRRALKAAAAEEDWWAMLANDSIEDLLTWRTLLGVGLGELVWTEEDPHDPAAMPIARIRNGRNVPRLKVWHPRWLRYDFISRRWLLMVEGGNEIEVRPGRGKWVLLTAGSERPWSKGLWRGMGVLCLLKAYARDDWSEMNEKFAKGILVAKAPSGAEPSDRALLVQDLRDMGRDGVICLPVGWDFDAVQLDANSWETYQAQITLANTSMAITAVGSDLPTESKKGAGTGANLQSQVRQDYLEADAASAEADLHLQVLSPWADANFGDPDVAPYPSYQVAPAEDRMQLGQAFQAFTAGLVNLDKAGWQFKDEDDVEEHFGIALETKPEADEPDPVAAPGFPMLPPGPSLPGAPLGASRTPAALVVAFDAYARSRRSPLRPAERRSLARTAKHDPALACEEFASMWTTVGGGRRFRSGLGVVVDTSERMAA